MTQHEKDEQFLADVARLEAEGRPMREIAKHLGIAPGTLTYRLARLGYTLESRIVDLRTGEALSARLAADAAGASQEEAA